MWRIGRWLPHSPCQDGDPGLQKRSCHQGICWRRDVSHLGSWALRLKHMGKQSWEEKAALTQHAQKRGTWSAETCAYFCPFISLPFTNYNFSAQSDYILVLERLFWWFQRNESKWYIIWTFTPSRGRKKKLPCLVSNRDQFYHSRKDFTSNQKTCKYKVLNSSSYKVFYLLKMQRFGSSLPLSKQDAKPWIYSITSLSSAITQVY